MAETITEKLVNRTKHRFGDARFDVNQFYKTNLHIKPFCYKNYSGPTVYVRECTLLFWLCTRDDGKFSDVLDQLLATKRCNLYKASPFFYYSRSADAPKEKGSISALRAAVSNDNYDVAEKLLQNGANVEDVYSEPFPALLSFAIERKNTRVVKLLVDHGSDVNVRHGLDECTALNAACSRGYTDIARVLLDAGCDMKLDSNKTLLVEAVESELVDIVKLLLEYGCDVNTRGKYGRTLDECTALNIACSRNCADIARLLLDAGCDMNLDSKKKRC